MKLKHESQGVDMQPLGCPERAGLIKCEEWGLVREYLGAARHFFGTPGVFSGQIGGRKEGLVKPTIQDYKDDA
jgi:hypothetical protein